MDAKALPKYLISGIFPSIPFSQNLSHLIKSGFSLLPISLILRTSSYLN
jgi:hypothetical protein